MQQPHDTHDHNRKRNRIALLLIFALFFGTMLVAGLLRFSGWRPHGSKNFGEMLDPPGDLRALSPRLLDGGEYVWKSGERTWRIVVAPPAECGASCSKLAHDIDTVWQLFGKDADDVHVLWSCATADCKWPAGTPAPATLKLLQPDPRLRAGLPRLDERVPGKEGNLPVYVVDPYGFVILRYPPGFDPAGLRADVAKLLKLK